MNIIVTGGNSGVGKAAAGALAAAGHDVVIACRTIDKAERAAAEMVGDVTVRHLDLADLASVRRFAETVESVDILINNAGVMGLPLTRTVDGFEAHMGVNHLGHFALTCLLADRITDRVVCVGSATYVLGMLVVDDLNWHTRQYSRWRGYADSKLAVMAFVAELARRGARVYVSDPGATNTEITRATPPLMRWLGNRKHQITHSAAVGAVSTLQAVVTDLPSGSYIAPRLAGLYGRPRATTLRHKAVDPLVGRRLWERSVELTGCDWPG